VASEETLTPSYGAHSSNEPQGMAGQAKEQVEAQAERVASRVSGQLRSQIDTRSTQVAEQIAPFARALHTAGTQLQDEGNSAAGRAGHRLADQVEQLSGYLQESHSDRLLSDLERFAGKRPWLAGGIGVAVGFLAARFLKASAESRYTASGRMTGRGDLDWPLTREAEATVSTLPTPGDPTDSAGMV
jgi:ElaB/YqjD/DUF883 family membrane-anchored ribosome-binding protein